MAQAQVPRQIHYQGRLITGTNLVNGPVWIAFRLYPTLAGGTALYGQTGGVTVVDGLYAATVGDGSAAFAQVFTNQALYLEVAVNGVDLSPRERIEAVAYALRADGVSTGAITTAMIAAGAVGSAQLAPNSVTAAKLAAGSVGSSALAADSVGAAALADGAVTPDKLSARYWGLGGNTDAVADVSYLGTVLAVPMDIRVQNARVMRFQPFGPHPSIIGGYTSNTVMALIYSAVVAGGGDEGGPNRVTDDFGVIGGGQGNRAGNDNGTYDDAVASTVAGGQSNRATLAWATVAGGYQNSASARGTFIGGGYSNAAAGSESVIAGGFANRALGSQSVVGGGLANTSAASYAVVGGGANNRAGEIYAAVAGGEYNSAPAMFGAIGGGRYNRAGGLIDSTVATP